MKKIIGLIIGMLMLSSFAVLGEDDTIAVPTLISAENDVCSYMLNNLNIKVGTEFDKAIPYKNERFNAYKHDGTVVGHIVIEDREVTSVGCDLTTDQTFNIYVKDLDTVKYIAESEKPIDAFNEKLSSKDIEIKGEQVTKKIKGFFTKVGVRIASWFS